MTKRLSFITMLAVLTLTLSGCASTGTRAYEENSVKCPACGYEFNQPSKS